MNETATFKTKKRMYNTIINSLRMKEATERRHSSTKIIFKNEEHLSEKEKSEIASSIYNNDDFQVLSVCL